MILGVGIGVASVVAIGWAIWHFKRRKLHKLEKQAKKTYTFDARNFIASKDGAKLKINLNIKYKYSSFEKFIWDKRTFVNVMLNSATRLYLRRIIGHTSYYAMSNQNGSNATIQKNMPIIEKELKAGINRYASRFGVSIQAVNIKTVASLKTPDWINDIKNAERKKKDNKLAHSGVNMTAKQRKMGNKKPSNVKHGGINW